MTTLKLDFDSLSFATDPDKTLAALRKEEGIYSYTMPNGAKAWLVSRRKDIEEVLTNGHVFTVSANAGAESYENNPFSKAIPKPLHLLATDGQQHLRLREPLEKFFTQNILESYSGFITNEVQSIIKGWSSGNELDLARALSYLVPVKVISKILGLTWDDHFPLYAQSLQLVKSSPNEHLKNVTIFHQIIRDTIEKYKKQNDTNNIITVLLHAGLTDDEVLSMSLLLFIAGSGTTASLISQGLRYMIINKARPDQLVDEILFRTSPANSAFPRYLQEDYRLDGTLLKKGDLVIALLQSANYDIKKGEDPLRAYLSFSKGIHHCIGWYLAKMEAEIVFDQFYKAFPNSKILKEEWFSNIVSRDLASLMVKLG
ncbi:cytochrome P450 [Sphingobacterium detergens]|uniref:Cytochrome P450 n=1 Tax=Sphingobacterium detergens TaxID=1145106 RepID=A0A420BK47_SPHD1|nr:cytochrome P450 [Sphingobacterium detergens]RKE57093.1 cytochrome P450 [Sphingobacterium detergens]